MPVNKKEEEEFIFEVSGVTFININYSLGMGYTPNTPYDYDFSPLPKDTSITNHFSYNRDNTAINIINYGMIERPTTEDGEEITKEKFPEYFTDFPIHDIEHGKYSENMILPKNPKVTIDWGDGNIDTYDTPQFGGTSITIDGKTTQYKYFSGYKNLYSGHRYEKSDTYIIKIKGFFPSLVLPNGTTKIINWGNIGLRSIYSICANCASTIVDFGSPKNLEKVVTSSAMFGRPNSCMINDLSFINNMPSLVNATSMFYYSNIQNIPDDAFTNSKYLCYLTQCFGRINNEIEVGNNFAKDLTELRQADYLFTDTNVKRIGNNAFYGCKSLYYITHMFTQNSSNIYLESIGNNFMRGCTSLTSVCQLFYYQYKLKKIGAGLLRECPYIRSSQDIFYYCDVLEKVPDNLFYDLEVNPNFVRNRFCFNSFLYKGYNNLWNKSYAELQEYVTEIGSNMFSSAFFASGGELYFSTQFSNTFTYSVLVEQSVYKYEYFTLYKGLVPDLWNYMDSLYNTATATEPLSKGDYFFGFYGYQKNDWTGITGYNYMNNITNYESIPKPSGNLIRSHIPPNDQLWLSCTYWNEFRVTIYLTFPTTINVNENGNIIYDNNDISTQTVPVNNIGGFIIKSSDGTEHQEMAASTSFEVEFTKVPMLNALDKTYNCTFADEELAHATSNGTVYVFALPYISKYVCKRRDVVSWEIIESNPVFSRYNLYHEQTTDATVQVLDTSYGGNAFLYNFKSENNKLLYDPADNLWFSFSIPAKPSLLNDNLKTMSEGGLAIILSFYNRISNPPENDNFIYTTEIDPTTINISSGTSYVSRYTNAVMGPVINLPKPSFEENPTSTGTNVSPSVKDYIDIQYLSDGKWSQNHYSTSRDRIEATLFVNEQREEYRKTLPSY